MKTAMLAFLAVLILGLVGCESAEGKQTMSDELGLLPNKVQDGWSTTGQLTIGNTKKTVSLQADFPQSDAYTVEFSKSDNKGYTEALITWSVEGNWVSRRVSVGNGVSLTGVAQAIRVVISDVSPSPQNVNYFASVQVSRGERAYPGVPTTLAPVDTQNIGVPFNAFTQHAHQIPGDSGASSVQVVLLKEDTVSGALTPVDPGDVTIMQAGSSGLANVQYDASERTGFEPIVPGTTQMILQTNQAIANTTLWYTIIYGIDG